MPEWYLVVALLAGPRRCSGSPGRRCSSSRCRSPRWPLLPTVARRAPRGLAHALRARSRRELLEAPAAHRAAQRAPAARAPRGRIGHGLDAVAAPAHATGSRCPCRARLAVWCEDWREPEERLADRRGGAARRWASRRARRRVRPLGPRGARRPLRLRPACCFAVEEHGARHAARALPRAAARGAARCRSLILAALAALLAAALVDGAAVAGAVLGVSAIRRCRRRRWRSARRPARFARGLRQALASQRDDAGARPRAAASRRRSARSCRRRSLGRRRDANGTTSDLAALPPAAARGAPVLAGTSRRCSSLSLLATPLALLDAVPLKIAVDSVARLGAAARLPRRARPGRSAEVADGAARVRGRRSFVLIALLTQLQQLSTSMLGDVHRRAAAARRSARALFRHVQRLSLAYHDREGHLRLDLPHPVRRDRASSTSPSTALTPFVTAGFMLARDDLRDRADRLAARARRARDHARCSSSSPGVYRRRLRDALARGEGARELALSVVQEVLTACASSRRSGRRSASTSASSSRARAGHARRASGSQLMRGRRSARWSGSSSRSGPRRALRRRPARPGRDAHARRASARAWRYLASSTSRSRRSARASRRCRRRSRAPSAPSRCSTRRPTSTERPNARPLDARARRGRVRRRVVRATATAGRCSTTSRSRSPPGRRVGHRRRDRRRARRRSSAC